MASSPSAASASVTADRSPALAFFLPFFGAAFEAFFVPFSFPSRRELCGASPRWLSCEADFLAAVAFNGGFGAMFFQAEANDRR